MRTFLGMDQALLPQFDLQLRVLGFFGLWQPQIDTRASRIRRYVSHSVFVLVTLIMPLINHLYFGEKLENISVHTALYLGPNLKIPILLFRMKTFVEFFDDLRNLLDFTKMDKNLERATMKKHVKIMTRIMKFFFVVITLIGSIELVNALRNHELPYKSWIPQNNPFVKDHLVLFSIAQVLLIACAESISVSLEFLPVFFTGMASVLLAELSERMKLSSETSIDEENDCLELKTCVQLHQRIKTFVYKIEKRFSAMLFIQGFFSSAYLCFYAIFLSSVCFSDSRKVF
jgi:hypothetical protein